MILARMRLMEKSWRDQAFSLDRMETRLRTLEARVQAVPSAIGRELETMKERITGVTATLAADSRKIVESGQTTATVLERIQQGLEALRDQADTQNANSGISGTLNQLIRNQAAILTQRGSGATMAHAPSESPPDTKLQNLARSGSVMTGTDRSPDPKLLARIDRLDQEVSDLDRMRGTLRQLNSRLKQFEATPESRSEMRGRTAEALATKIAAVDQRVDQIEEQRSLQIKRLAGLLSRR